MKTTLQIEQRKELVSIVIGFVVATLVSLGMLGLLSLFAGCAADVQIDHPEEEEIGVSEQDLSRIFLKDALGTVKTTCDYVKVSCWTEGTCYALKCDHKLYTADSFTGKQTEVITGLPYTYPEDAWRALANRVTRKYLFSLDLSRFTVLSRDFRNWDIIP